MCMQMPDASPVETQVNPQLERGVPAHTGLVESSANVKEHSANGPSPCKIISSEEEPVLCRIVTIDDQPVLCKVVSDATGWTTMAKAVRGVDVAKVESHKDDLDNLLLFAGLFSAVITPFIIESYKTLRTDLDPKSSFQLLQRIAGQTDSYTIITASGTSIFINSTESTPDSQSSSPEHSDIVVNRLWFASLILTLVTASFAIFVKQWLREWLYTDYTSAKSRLRIRHFRLPGIQKYRVFEIAAGLPLLLQIALGLFLVGLCYFTSSIHPDLVQISISMVAVWALIIIIAGILPLISPQCPYKLVFLNSFLRALRILGRRALLRIRPQESAKPPDFYEEASVVKRADKDLDILVKVDDIQSDDHLLTTAIKDCVKHIDPPPNQIIDFLLNIIAHRARVEVNKLRTSLPLDCYTITITEPVWDMVTQLSLEALGDRRPNQNVKEDKSWITSLCFLFIFTLSFPVQRPLDSRDNRRCSALREYIKTEPWEIGQAFGNMRLLDVSGTVTQKSDGAAGFESPTYRDILLILSIILEESQPLTAVKFITFMAGLLDTRQHIWQKEPCTFSGETSTSPQTQAASVASRSKTSTSESPPSQTQGISAPSSEMSTYPQAQGASVSGGETSTSSESEGSLLSAMLAPVLKTYLQHHSGGVPKDEMPVFFKALKIILYQDNVEEAGEGERERRDSNGGNLNKSQGSTTKDILGLYMKNNPTGMKYLLDFLLKESVHVGVPDGATKTLGRPILSWFENLGGDWNKYWDDFKVYVEGIKSPDRKENFNLLGFFEMAIRAVSGLPRTSDASLFDALHKAIESDREERKMSDEPTTNREAAAKDCLAAIDYYEKAIFKDSNMPDAYDSWVRQFEENNSLFKDPLIKTLMKISSDEGRMNKAPIAKNDTWRVKRLQHLETGSSEGTVRATASPPTQRKNSKRADGEQASQSGLPTGDGDRRTTDVGGHKQVRTRNPRGGV